MRYDDKGVFVGDGQTDGYSWIPMWHMEKGYRAYGSGEISVGDYITHNGMDKRVTAIREAKLDLYGDGYFALMEDGSQTFIEHTGRRHVGMTPHSGRYEWGSGNKPYQRAYDFMARDGYLKSQKGPDGKPLFTQKQIAAQFGMTTTEYRKMITLQRAEMANYENEQIFKWREKGMSFNAIAQRLNMAPRTVEERYKSKSGERMTKTLQNAKALKDRLEEVPYIQVGAGSEFFMNNCTETSLKGALKSLEQEGYTIENIQLPHGKGKNTTVKVLAKPGVGLDDIYKNIDKIALPTSIQMKPDGSFVKTPEFVSVDPNRIQVVYAEDGGTQKDGLIEVRRNVPELSLGKNNYVQGRILVDGDHYLKGMIAYADDLPPGVDIRFNTNKTKDHPMIDREDEKMSVLKKVKDDKENPFGANLKLDKKLQRFSKYYIDPETGEEKQSAINVVKEEGDVDDWNKTLPSQFLSKQPPKLAEAQLKTTRDIWQSKIDEINGYNNDVIKQKLLLDAAGAIETDSVHLAAAALPRQKTKFILPLDNVADNEVYCPGFHDGEEVALIRFPHASITEIPICKVNNENKKAKQQYGDAMDAVGISHAAAERLSGADFDGDTVLVIPMDKVRITNKEPFKGMKGFETSMYEDRNFPPMSDHDKGLQMGIVSNLLTDMTIQKATDDELERALKHSMVVIDAQKHNLNWKRSEEDFAIQALREKYQVGGASTFLSRSTGEEHIPERKLVSVGKMSPEQREQWKEGFDIYRNTGRETAKPHPLVSDMTPEEKAKWKRAKKDKDKKAQQEVIQSMREDGRLKWKREEATDEVKRGAVHDPEELVSTGNFETTTQIERVYGKHAKELKEMARQVRKTARALEMPKADPAAKKEYAEEVKSIENKLNIAKRNQPLERQALAIMNSKFNAWKDDHPYEDYEHQQRKRAQLMEQARAVVGAKKLVIGSDENPLTPREWEAIQNRAISPTKVKDILANADMRVIKKYALPKDDVGLSGPELARAKMYLNKGYTRMEVAEMLDISQSTLVKAIGKANL